MTIRLDSGGEPSIYASAQELERRCWRSLWLPALPLLGLGIGLMGWAISEPANAERLSWSGWCVLVPASLVAARAFVRTLHSCRGPGGDIVAVTLGLWRPRIVVSQRLAGTLDSPALDAVYAHEATHVRHRDPLRILLARFATDLVWPSRSAARRYRAWRNALELARDEEALAAPSSVKASDLAAAILGAARLQRGMTPVAATLLTDGALLQARVELLLDRENHPRHPTPPANHGTTILLAAMLSLWISLGASAGEGIVERFMLR